MRAAPHCVGKRRTRRQRENSGNRDQPAISASYCCLCRNLLETIHRAFYDQGRERGVADFVIDYSRADPLIIGQLVNKDLRNELTGEAYVVVDGTDGRAHHVRLRSVEFFEHDPEIDGLVPVRRFGSADAPFKQPQRIFCLRERA